MQTWNKPPLSRPLFWGGPFSLVVLLAILVIGPSSSLRAQSAPAGSQEQVSQRRIAELETQLKQRDIRIAALEKQVAELIKKLGTNPEPEWIPMFNGKNLDGWIPKITGYELGENFGNTFRVEDGVMKVAYDKYGTFGGRFGHLFYQTPYSRYKMRIEYRFVGNQVPDGPGFAFRNSGIMIHCQDPATIRKEQGFPVSIEVQLLGGNGKDARTTMNLCTPGTHVVMNGQLEKTHCINSKSETYHGDQWVSAEIEVNGGEVIRHFVNGQLVLEYEKPQLDDGDDDAKQLIKDGKVALTGGYISLQSESHPCEFRLVEIMPID